MGDADIVKQQRLAETPRAVPYGPVPMSWTISQGSSSNGPIVVITVQTPSGDTSYFVVADVARQIGEALIQHAQNIEN